jgi:predicted PurR-regulated permease PerM
MLHYSIYYLGVTLLIALLGFNRTMGFWGYFFASLLLTPIMGVLLLLTSGRKVKPKKTVIAK